MPAVKTKVVAPTSEVQELLDKTVPATALVSVDDDGGFVVTVGGKSTVLGPVAAQRFVKECEAALGVVR